MAAAALLTAGIKFEGRLNLQVEGDGPLRLLLAQCDHHLHLRATARYDQDLPAEQLDFGDNGRLLLALEGQKPGERYQGVVPLAGDDLAGAIEHYFTQSEQRPARGRRRAPPVRARRWSACCCSACRVRPARRGCLESLQPPARDPEFSGIAAMAGRETLLRRVFAEETIRLFDPTLVSFREQYEKKKKKTIIPPPQKQKQKPQQ